MSEATAIAAVATTTGITGGGTFATSNFAAPMGATEITAASALIGGLATADTAGILVIP
jgi:hypothetical protein